VLRREGAEPACRPERVTQAGAPVAARGAFS
jgi:hypothetical protein